MLYSPRVGSVATRSRSRAEDWMGPVEVTPLSMASAYATFANGGVHCSPIVIAQA